jgi:ubiquinone/menaquinone biosynthesis C-methylase UbiE
MAFSDPRKNVGHLELREGMRVADFGAGSGHYATALSRLVHDSGRVYAIDLQKELLRRIKNLSRTEHAGNIEVIWGDIEQVGGSKLPQNSMDAVVMSNMLFQVEHRRAAVEEAKRVLKQGGKVLVIDWADSFGGLGPRSEDVVKPESAQALFKDLGFSTVKELSDAGDHHYGFVFKKDDSR